MNAAVAIAVLQDLRQTAAGQAARAVGLHVLWGFVLPNNRCSQLLKLVCFHQ